MIYTNEAIEAQILATRLFVRECVEQMQKYKANSDLSNSTALYNAISKLDQQDMEVLVYHVMDMYYDGFSHVCDRIEDQGL